MRLKNFCTLLCLFVLFLHQGKAQICTGSLGDPVVNVTFGSGGTTGAALTGNTTTYTYTSTDCPPDGSYTIVSSSNACFGDSWHTVSSDHTTGDANGHMMVVNASVTPGDFYVDTIKNLCAQTTYEFSAWILNILKPTACSPNPIHPNLVFNIENTSGTVLGTYTTGNILETGSPSWQQYGLFFTTPVGNPTIIIRITNSAPGGCGNDLILDDIAFKPCGPALVAVAPVASNNAVKLCTNTLAPVAIGATVGTGYINPALQWQQSTNGGQTWTDIPGATTNNYVFTKTTVGTYQYRLSAAENGNIAFSNCRVASNVIDIVISDTPVATINSFVPVCTGKNVSLTATGTGSYSWLGPGSFTASTSSISLIASNTVAGIYQLTITDAAGCKGTDTTLLTVLPTPTAIASNPVTICAGDQTTLTASGASTFSWTPTVGLDNPSSATPLAKPDSTTIYVVTVTNNQGCSDTASVITTVNKKPVISAGPDKVLVAGNAVQIEGSSIGSDVRFVWTPSDYLDDPTRLQPISTVPHDTTYILQAISTIGCGQTEDTMRIKVFNDVYIPSAFTPNGDQVNDTWFIESLAAYPTAQLKVFDRFGKVVFQSDGLHARWDGTYKGTDLTAGTYVYYINLNNRRGLIKGTVLLIR